MRRILLLSLLLAFAGQAGAATITARITATVLAQARISFPAADTTDKRADVARSPQIQSIRDVQFELTHDRNQVCRFGANKMGQDQNLTLARCQTVTINFN